MILKDTNYSEIKNKFPTMERLFRSHVMSMIAAAITIKEHKYHFEDGKVGY